MGKWLIAGGAVVVALLGLLLWQLLDAPPKPSTVPGPRAFDAGARNAPAVADARVKPPSKVRDAGAALRADQLDPGSEEFTERMDIVVPAKLRSHAASCYDGSLDGDLSMNLTLTLHVIDGEVGATDVRILKSEIGAVDKELEQCLIDEVAKARWRADDLPNYKEEQDLFIRLRTLKKYKTRKEPED